jgi:hypothetical protein
MRLGGAVALPVLRLGGLSDDSPNQHATSHYQETDHPVAVSLELGPRQRWCHVHQRTV